MPKKTLMVVEDDTDTRELLQRALGSEYEVVGVSYGEGVPQLAESHRADLVVLDIGLPGISGIEVCRQIRANAPTRKVPILFLTSFGGDALFTEGIIAGGDGWMTKPFEVPKLRERIEYLLRGPAAAVGQL